MRGLFRSEFAMAAAFAIDAGAHPIDKASPRSQGKAAQAQLSAGKVSPSFNHISRQVRRREQRKALKRLGVQA